ncbi:MAG TPA: hypothetical protein VIY08_15860 [Candidatus Nitrosocosmicus sp.]
MYVLFMTLFVFYILSNIFLSSDIQKIIYFSFAQNSTNSTHILNDTEHALHNNKHYFIKAGQGNSSVSYNNYYPSTIEITKGDSITWYNGMDVPLPHTVTFLQGLDNMEKIGIPFYVKNTTKFESVIDNTGEPLTEPSKNGTQIVMLLNSRAMNPTVITNESKVLHLGIDTTYIFNGNERFVNSGPLLSLDEKQNFDYSFSNFFTIIFNKPGLYEYSCLFHPWMIGKILVKPK